MVRPGDQLRVVTNRDVRCWHERPATTELLLDTDLVDRLPPGNPVPDRQIVQVDHRVGDRPWLPDGEGPWFLVSFAAGLDRWQTVVEATEVHPV